jgi:hypothetical protein
VYLLGKENFFVLSDPFHQIDLSLHHVINSCAFRRKAHFDRSLGPQIGNDLCTNR